MAHTFIVQIANSETGEEQRCATAYSEADALRLAQREAERLVKMLNRKRLVPHLRARTEVDSDADGGYRWLVREPAGESSEAVAYTVTVLTGDENPDD